MLYGRRTARGATLLSGHQMLKPSRLLPLVLTAAIALAVPAGAGAEVRAGAAAAGAGYAPGEVVVRYARGADQAAVERAAGIGGARTVAPRTRVLRIRDGESVADTVRELRALPEVATAAPNATARIADFIPSDPGNAGVAGGWQQLQWNFLAGAGVNAPGAWQHLIDAGQPGGRGVVVAVLDTGVAYSTRRRFRKSTDFRRADFVRGHDFVDGDKFPHDENGHGTHVASTIGESTHNNRGVTGLAYGAKIMPIRVLNARGEGDTPAIASGIRYAVRHGADVINLSFEFDDRFRQYSASEIPDVLAAVRFARRRGSVVIGAAGNEGPLIAYPARAAQVLAVGATTITGCEAAYSNAGKDLDVVAPGGGLDAVNTRSQWDVDHCTRKIPGKPIIQQTFTRDGWVRSFGLRGPLYKGTSMASPHVAAIAALVIATGRLGPDPTPEMVEDHIKATSRDAGVPGFDPYYGYGIVDAAAALR